MADLDWEALDDRLETEKKRNDAQQRSVLDASVKSNPDKYQTIRELTKSSGLSKDIVERNEKEVSERQRVREIQSIVKTSPVLSRKMKDPDFAQLSHDDVENLFKIENTAKRISGPKPGFMSTAKGIAKSLPQGFELARQGIRLQWAELIGSERMRKDALRKYEAAQTDVILTTPEFESSTARGLYGGASSTMRQLPGLAASIATRSTFPSLAVMGQLTEAEAYGKYVSRGATREEALVGAMGEGATEVLTELIPMKFLVGKFGKIGAGKFLTGLLAREVPSEQVATLVQDAIDTAIANPDKTWGEYFEERPGAAYETFLATLVQSGIMGGLSTASQFASDTAKADKAIEDQEFLDSLVQDVNESKLRERSPEELRSFLDESLGADNNVYLTPEDAKGFFQSHPEIGDQINEELFQSIQESLSTGSDVIIPKADYLTYFTEFHEELSPILRNDMDGMTVQEAEEFIQSGQGEFEKEAEQILVEQEQQLEREQSAENVARQVKEQILKTGRFKEDVAEQYAQLHKAFASTMAQKLNKTPEEVYEQFGLTVKGAPIAGEKLEQADYRIDHKPMTKEQGAASLDDLTPAFGEDIYTENALQFFGSGDKREQEIVKILSELRGKPDAKVTIYRGVPEDINEINPGDWVTLSKEVAEEYGPNVIEKEVTAKDITGWADSLLEYGYFPEGDVKIPPVTQDQGPGDKLTDKTPLQPESEENILYHATNKQFDKFRPVVPGGDVGIHFGSKASAQERAKNKEWIAREFIPRWEIINGKKFNVGKWGYVTKDSNYRLIKSSLPPKNQFIQLDKDPGSWDAEFLLPLLKTQQLLSKDDANEWVEIKTTALINAGMPQKEARHHAANNTMPLALGKEHKYYFVENEAWAKFLNEKLLEKGKVGFSYPNAIEDGSAGDSFVVFSDDHIASPDPTQRTQAKEITETPEFKNWFKDSKVVDEKGEPLVVYHGTMVGLDDDFAFRSLYGGIYFAENPQNSEQYGDIGEYYLKSENHLDATNDNAKKVFDKIEDRLFDEEDKETILLDLDGDKTTLWDLVKWGDLYSLGRNIQNKVINEVQNLGYSGIKMMDNHGSGDDVVHIVFSSKQVKSVKNLGTFDPNDPRILYQKERGFFQPDTNIISLLENADLSTFLHESGHFFLEAMNQFPELNQDMDTVFEWFGTDRDSWNKMTLEERRENHEKFARGFEAYLFEGKAPSLELQPIFQRFRDWLINVYRSLRNLNVELTKEVRQVFDRMLATEEQIREAETARAYTPIFEDSEGLTEKQWSEYQKLDQERRTDAREELQSRSLKDMKWLSNAKAKALRKLQAENKVRRREIREEVAEEVSRETVYQAIRFLRRGEYLDENGNLQKADLHRLDIDQLNEMFPYGQEMDIPDWRSLGYGKYGMLQKDGLDPEDLAHQYQYSSAEHMIRDILEAPPQKEYIDAITDQRMLEKYGDITNPIQMERAAEEAIHNDSHTRFLHTELKYLTKSGQGNVIAKAARQFAEQALNRKKIRDIKSNQYLSAQTRAGNNALKAISKGDRESAIEHKRAQVLNNHFYRTAVKAEKDIEKWVRYVKKFSKEGTRKNLDTEYLEQIDDLLSAFDFTNKSLKQIDKKQTLAEFIKQQEEEGFQPIIDEALVESTKRKHYKNMTLEEFRGHIDTIKHIEHLGRLKKKLLTDRSKREFNQRMDEARLAIELNANRAVKERGTPTDTISKISAGFRQFAAIHRKAASIIREMDGSKDNGVMWNLFVRAVNEAGDKSVEMKAEASEELGKLFDQVKIRSGLNNIRAPKYLIPGTDISMTDEQRLMFALNWGNEGNRQRLMDGGLAGKRRLSPSEAQAILDTLTPQELGFVQGIFDFIETYKEQIAEQEKRLTGKTPNWVEPAEIVTKNGTIKGGYFPAKYDTVLSTRSESLEALTNIRLGMKGAFNAATTRNSYTKDRAQEVHGRPLLLSFGVINQHINEVIHRLSYQDWISDANRILKALDPTIREYYGPEILKELRDTVKAVAEGDKGASNVFESAINHIRVGSTIVGMGYRFTTAAIQPTGFAQSIARIGVGPVARGMRQFLGNPVATYKDVMKKSAFMRDRNRTLQREVNEVLNKVRGQDKVGFIKQNAFWLIGKTQMAVDIPTWLGAYDKALQDLNIENALDQTERNELDEKAIQIANQAVRDSQSAGLIFDLAGIQRGGPILKTFTNFYSYFSATYNLNVEAYRRANLKSPVGMAKFMGDMFVLNIIPTIMAVLIYEAIRGGCEGELECIGEKLADEQINYLAGQMVGVRELSGALVAATGGKYYGYQGPAGMRFFSEVGKAGQQLAQGEPDEALRKALLNVTGIITHLPTGQLNTTLDALNAVENGEVEGARTVLAPLAGKPRE